MSPKVLFVIALTVSGCASTTLDSTSQQSTTESAAFELGPAASISPTPLPRPEDWTSFDIIRVESGDRARIEIEAFGSTGIRGRFSDGCLWTRQADWFSPSDSWADCGQSNDWRTAQATVRRTGSLWPLTVGATAQYEREARSTKTGAVSRRTTTCAVIDAVAVRRSTGEIEAAHKVRCEDGRRVRTSWWSPSSGLLFYRQNHETRGVERFWERVVE